MFAICFSTSNQSPFSIAAPPELCAFLNTAVASASLSASGTVLAVRALSQVPTMIAFRLGDAGNATLTVDGNLVLSAELSALSLAAFASRGANLLVGASIGRSSSRRHTLLHVR
jgi:hypothetical protein